MYSVRTAALLLLGATAAPCNAEIPSDIFVQSDRLHGHEVDPTNRYAIEDTVNPAHFLYLKSMIAEGYPLRSTILHGLTQGISVSDTAHMITLADPALGTAVYQTTLEMLELMPGWVCGLQQDTDLRYPLYYAPDSAGASPTIEMVAKRFFDDGELLGYRRTPDGRWTHPDWTTGEHHLQANLDELIALSRAERRDPNSGGPDGLWYQTRPGHHTANDDDTPVFVSLYKKGRRIILDTTEAHLLERRERGTATAPVIFIYNDSHAIPLSELVADSPQTPAALDALTIDAVATRYFQSGERLTPPREWRDSDFHIMAPIDDIQELYRRNWDTQKASDARKQVQIEIEGAGFWPPVKVTLNAESGLLWADSRSRVTAARGLGLEQVPVVFFYHEIRRFPCDADADCAPAVCRAVTSAGGDPGVDRCPPAGNRS